MLWKLLESGLASEAEAKGLTKTGEQEMGPGQETVGQVQTGKQVDGQAVK